MTFNDFLILGVKLLNLLPGNIPPVLKVMHIDLQGAGPVLSAVLCKTVKSGVSLLSGINLKTGMRLTSVTAVPAPPCRITHVSALSVKSC